MFNVCRICRGLLACAMVVMATAGPASAEFMLDRVPGDAVFYVGWQGTDTLGEAFENSHFGSIRRDTNADQFITGVLPMAGMFLGEHGDELTRTASLLQRTLWARPWAMFVGDPTAVGEGLGPRRDIALPSVRLGLFVDAGPHATQVRRALEQWERTMTDENTPATWIDDDGVIGLMVGYSERQVRDIRVLWRSLSRDTGFSRARRQVISNPALLAYVNVERLVGRIADAAALPGFIPADQLDTFVSELGIDGLKRVVYAGGLDGRMWQSHVFVDAPAPRRGLLRLFDAEPVTERDLRAVPRSATWLSAYRLDPAVALTAVNAAMQRLPQPLAPLDADDRDALAEGLGDLWLFYSDPSFVAATGPGVSLVHPLRNAGAVEAAMTRMTRHLNDHDAAQPAIEPVVIDGITIHQLTMPDTGFALAWAVADGRLFVGTGAATVAAARGHARRPGNDVTRSSRYQRVRERLGDPPAGARLTFADLQSTAPSMFQGYQQAMQFDALGFNAGVNLPDLRRLMPYLIPAGKAAWADDRGWHARSVGPFPGASLLSPCATINLGTGTLATMMYFSYPATAAP